MTPTRRGVLALAALAPLAARAAGPVLLLGSTTTTENSGLLAHLIPQFEADTGIAVRVVVGATGRILRLFADGDLDATLTHDPIGEETLVASGVAASLTPVMFNDFLIAGPADDPAEIAAASIAGEALARIAAARARFYSRGDDSGTHRKERALWPAPKPGEGADAPGWYRETGAGMGATLNIAATAPGYLLVDRGTWASFGNRGDLRALFDGGDDLRNPYGVLIPNPTTRPDVYETARRFSAWMRSPAGAATVNGFRIQGEQIFFAVGE